MLMCGARARAQEVVALLMSKSAMLDEYFSIGVAASPDGPLVTHLPRLVDGHAPQMHALPDFVLLLAWKVRGFHTFTRKPP